MRIIEVCPECGADIESLVICTNPPIPVKKCTKCDWRWEDTPEETIRIPFNPDGYDNISIPDGQYALKIPTTITVSVNTLLSREEKEKLYEINSPKKKLFDIIFNRNK